MLEDCKSPAHHINIFLLKKNIYIYEMTHQEMLQSVKLGVLIQTGLISMQVKYGATDV